MNASNVITLPVTRPGHRRAPKEASKRWSQLAREPQKASSSHRTDEMTELLLAVRDRQDRAAFAALFRHFAPRVKSYLRGFGDDAGRAEDVLQECFAAVWSKARQFDPDRASASTWIFTIARNQRIDAFRRERRPQFDPNDPAFVPEPELGGEESTTVRERSEHVVDAMAALSDEQREVLRLSFFEEHSHDVIASKLGLPVGTVKSRIRLAYGHLRSRLEDHAGGLP